MGDDKDLRCLGQAKSFALYECVVEIPIRKTSDHDLKLSIELPVPKTDFKPGQFAMLRWGSHLVGRPYTIIAHKKKSEKRSVLQLWARPTLGPTRELWSLKRGDVLWLTLPLGRGIDASIVDLYGLEMLDKPMLFLSEGALSAAVWAYFEQRRKTRLALGADQQDLWWHRETAKEFVDAELMSRSYARPDQIVMNDDWSSVDFAHLKSQFGMSVCALTEASFHQVSSRITDKKIVRAQPRMACGLGLCYGCTVLVEGQPRRACLEGPWFSSFEVPVGR